MKDPLTGSKFMAWNHAAALLGSHKKKHRLASLHGVIRGHEQLHVSQK